MGDKMQGSDKIRVLIVDDIADTREMIQRMLLFDSMIEVIGTAQSGKEAIELTQKLKPDVILMDINMPDMDGIAATEAIRKKVPFSQIIILSVQSDASYMRRAMLAGARDFLSKPPSIDDLTHAIRMAGAKAVEERQKAPVTDAAVTASRIQQGKIIAVYSPKGGTGVTTLATNLAISLQAENTPCALIDANLMYGDIAAFLYLQGKNTLLDLTQRVDDLDEEVVRDVMVTHPASGLAVLPAPARPDLADTVGEEEFSKLLTYLRSIYSYTIVDCTPFLSDPVKGALSVADVIILVVTQDIPSIKNANLFLSMADASGIRRVNILFVMNRYDKRILITPEKISENLKQEIAIAIPFDERIVASSIMRGIPFVTDNKGTPVAKAVQSLADIVKDRIVKLDSGQLELIVKK